MEPADPLDELLTCRLEFGRKAVEPCTIVIFGASGDLTARKPIPAFYHLCREKQLPTPFRIIGFARREKTDEAWRQELRAALEQFSRTKPIDEAVWAEFATNVSYCQGDISDTSAYKKLADRLASFSNDKLRRNLLFYLATSPSQFGEVVEHLHQTGLLRKEVASEPDQRVVVEKPFGHDLASAHKLNAELTRFAHEKQIFRIDHYLGKETVQNILMFRFSNSIFEQLWNRQSVDHVQITVSEKLGVGTRGGYYEEVGALRDMVQNHLLQVLALVAMEPPVTLEAECIRDEKVKLLKSIRLTEPGQVDANAITLRLQPNEGISLRFNGKVPGTSMEIRPVRMHFSYDSEFGAYTPEAYERLLLEAITGDATLFIRRDEVETAWRIVDPVRAAWKDHPLNKREFYPAGTWGPEAADDLLKARGHAWRNPQP